MCEIILFTGFKISEELTKGMEGMEAGYHLETIAEAWAIHDSVSRSARQKLWGVRREAQS